MSFIGISDQAGTQAGRYNSEVVITLVTHVVTAIGTDESIVGVSIALSPP